MFSAYPSYTGHDTGTFYEHFGSDNILPMDVGQGTFRPGSVRHGGHRVSKGTRYVLGAFILIEDRVEHVRRLKNRGSELRRKGKLDEAAKHFEWALAINPKCTTCESIYQYLCSFFKCIFFINRIFINILYLSNNYLNITPFCYTPSLYIQRSSFHV